MATLRVGCTGFNRCYAAGFVIELFDGDAARGLHRLKPVLRRWFLREPPIRNAMEQGCTG
jgi:hypothetical protein